MYSSKDVPSFSKSREVRKGNPLVRLKEYFDEFEIIKDAEELEFMGGLVGSLGYDYIRYTENLPDENEDEIGIETIQLMLASKFIAIDHETETFTAVVLDEDSKGGGKSMTVSQKIKHYLWIFIEYFSLIFFSFVALLPVVSCVITAFKTETEYQNTNVMTLPESWLNFDNFIQAFNKANMGRAGTRMCW